MQPQPMPSLDVIIPVKDRSEIQRCVRSLRQVRSRIAQVIICDGGSSDMDCVKELHELEQQPNVVVLWNLDAGFNKSKLLNQGIGFARSDYVLISDADIVWNAPAVEALLTEVVAYPNVICHVQDVEESQPTSVALTRDRYTYQIRRDPGETIVEVVANPPTANQRPGCGLICARKHTLLALGGYKEIFQGWGWEDQDLLMRATLLGAEIRTAGKVLHVSHPDDQRNRYHRYAAPSQTRNQNILTCLEAIASGHLWGDLPVSSKALPQPTSIRVQIPESLSNALR